MPHPLHDTIGNGGDGLGLAFHAIVEMPTGDSYVNPLPIAVVPNVGEGGRPAASAPCGGSLANVSNFDHEDACK